MNEERIQYLWKEILKEIGEDIERPGLEATPYRIVKMYKEVFRGYHEDPPKLTCFDDDHPTGLITDKGHFFSTCEHHGLPFFGTYYFGYIPNATGVYLGASKIGRAVDHFCAKLQTQERLTQEILNYIENVIQPAGSILLMSGRHLCKEMRGLKKWDSPFEVIEARGVLRENTAGCKDEFLSRLAARL